MKNIDYEKRLYFSKYIAIFFFLSFTTLLKAQTYYELYRNDIKIYGPATKEQCDNQKQERIKQDAIEELRKAKEYADKYSTLDVPSSPKVLYEIRNITDVTSSNTRSKNSSKIGGAPDISLKYPTRTVTPTSESLIGESNDVIMAAAVVGAGVLIISGIIKAAKKAKVEEAQSKFEEEKERVAYNKKITEHTYKDVSSQLLGMGTTNRINSETSYMSNLGLITDFDIKYDVNTTNPLEYNIDELFEKYYLEIQSIKSISVFFEEYYKEKTGRDINVIINKSKLNDNDRKAIEEYNKFVVSASKDLPQKVYAYKNQKLEQTDTLKSFKTLNMAVIANDVYSPGSIIDSYTDYIVIEDPEKAGEMRDIVNALNTLNGFNDDFLAKLYYNQANHRYVIAFRGSQSPLKSINDWVENSKNASGNPAPGIYASSQYASAATIGRLVDKLPYEVKSKISFTGHSKGGGQASLAGAITGLETYTFNAAGVDYEEKEYSNIKAFYSEYDPLNFAQDKQNLIISLKKVATEVLPGMKYLEKSVEILADNKTKELAHYATLDISSITETAKAIEKIEVKGHVPKAIGTRIKIENFKSKIPDIAPLNPLEKKVAEEAEKYISCHSMQLMQGYFEKQASKELSDWNELNKLQIYIENQVANPEKLLKRRRLYDAGYTEIH